MRAVDTEEFQANVDALLEIVDSTEPDPNRTDWSSQHRQLERADELAGWFLDRLDQLPEFTADHRVAEQLRLFVIFRAGTVAGLLEAGHRRREAKALLQRCVEVAAHPDNLATYRAALADPLAFTRLSHARWLKAKNRLDDARAIAATLREADPALATLALPIEKAPAPIKRAPMLGRVNGFGFGLYGQREVWPDGSYITTRWVSGLWLPVIPVDAFRVQAAGDGAYSFHGKVPLGMAARVWRWVLVALVVAFITWTGVNNYLEAPDRQLRLAMDDVAEMENSDPEGALRRYEELARQYTNLVEDQDELSALAEAWVRLATHDIEEPMRPEHTGQIQAVTARFDSLPDKLIDGPAGEALTAKLMVWVEQLDRLDPDHAPDRDDAKLELLALAETLAVGDQQRRQVEDAQRATRLALAEALAVDWPLEAILQLDQLGDDQASLRAIAHIVDELPDSPTLLTDVAPELRSWAADVRGRKLGELEESATRALGLVDRGRQLAEDPDRQRLFEEADVDQLRALLTDDPNDQDIALMLAATLRGRGELAPAAELLDGLGEPGRTTHSVQHLRASIAFDRGDADGSAELLEQVLRVRLPAFEDISLAYDRQLTSLQDRLAKRAEAGDIPTQYREGLISDDMDTARAAFSEWVDDEISHSVSLSKLVESYSLRVDVIPVAVLFGTVQLQRARSASGEQREQILGSAERAFMAIRGHASGMPDYHASLGQVYHRLGKREEGDAELAVLIDSGDAEQQFIAMNIYRDLGNYARARDIADQAYESAHNPMKQNIAFTRSMLAVGLDERETWLRRADTEQYQVKASLIKLEADRLRLAGKFRECARKFTESEAIFVRQPHTDGSSANNAAVALRGRYRCSGDLEDIDKAVEQLERSVSLQPNSGIVLSNLASILVFRAQLAILDEFLPVVKLRLQPGEATTLLIALAHSSQRERLRQVLRDSPDRQRAVDAIRHARALSPGSTDLVYEEVLWLDLAGDDSGLAKLADELEANERLYTDFDAANWNNVVAGNFDDLALAEIDTSLTGRAATRTAARRQHTRVSAALDHLDGVDQTSKARLDGSSVETTRAAVESLESAQRDWPSGLAVDGLQTALIQLAILETAADNPDLHASWLSRGRRHGITVLLVELIEAADPVLRTLAGQPSFVRALELSRELPAEDVTAFDLALATIGDDRALAARIAQTLALPSRDVSARIDARLRDFDESKATVAAFVERLQSETE